MGKINTRRLRSLNGRLGFLRKQRGGGWKFVGKKGKTIWRDLRPFEVKVALLAEPEKGPGLFRTFNGQSFRLRQPAPFKSKTKAKRKALIRRMDGDLARVVRVKGGWAVYTLGPRERVRRKR